MISSMNSTTRIRWLSSLVIFYLLSFPASIRAKCSCSTEKSSSNSDYFDRLAEERFDYYVGASCHCVHTTLDEISRLTSKQPVKKLTIEHANLKNISEETFNVDKFQHHLKYLHIKSCFMRSINPHTFFHMGVLHVLNISDSHIQELEELHIPKLTYLALERNEISNFKGICGHQVDWMLSVLKLSSLKIANNNYSPFYQCKAGEIIINDMDLRNFNLAKFTENKYLRIERDQINSLSDLNIREAEFVSLTVDHNNLNELDFNDLSSKELREFSARSNKIRTVMCTMNVSLKLEVLDLENNFISIFPDNLITCIPDLKTLNIKNNPIYYNDAAKFWSKLQRLQNLETSAKLTNDEPFSCHFSAKLERLVINKGTIKEIVNLQNCSYLKELIINYNRYMNYVNPKDLAVVENLEVLDLSYNNISSSVQLKSKKLTELNLQNNNIHNLTVEAFSGTPFLHNLTLANNPHIRKIMPGLFNNLIDLRHLNLRNTGLDSYSNITFIGLEILTNLNLDNNEITTVVPFGNNLKIEYLSMDYNKINEIEPNSLSGLFLNFLFLRGNDLVTFPCNAISPPHVLLETLDISFNQIDFLASCAFSRFGLLERLNLEHNHLQSLPPDVFRDNWHLKYLNLSSNLLTHLHPKLFYRTNELVVLDVSGNQLGSLKIDLSLYPGLKHLSLARNKMKCVKTQNLLRQIASVDVDISYDEKCKESNARSLSSDDMPQYLENIAHVQQEQMYEQQYYNRQQSLELHVLLVLIVGLLVTLTIVVVFRNKYCTGCCKRRFRQ